MDLTWLFRCGQADERRWGKGLQEGGIVWLQEQWLGIRGSLLGDQGRRIWLEVGSIFNILLFYFVFNTFQVTLERIVHVRKVACALGRVIVLKTVSSQIPADLAHWAPWLGDLEGRWEGTKTGPYDNNQAICHRFMITDWMNTFWCEVMYLF